MVFHCVHSLTLILAAFVILRNRNRGGTKDPESICRSTREITGPQLTLTMSVHLSVEVNLSVWVVLYGDRHILSYLCSRTSVSVSSILRLQNICLQYIYMLKAYVLKRLGLL